MRSRDPSALRISCGPRRRHHVCGHAINRRRGGSGLRASTRQRRLGAPGQRQDNGYIDGFLFPLDVAVHPPALPLHGGADRRPDPVLSPASRARSTDTGRRLRARARLRRSRPYSGLLPLRQGHFPGPVYTLAGTAPVEARSTQLRRRPGSTVKGSFKETGRSATRVWGRGRGPAPRPRAQGFSARDAARKRGSLPAVSEKSPLERWLPCRRPALRRAAAVRVPLNAGGRASAFRAWSRACRSRSRCSPCSRPGASSASPSRRCGAWRRPWGRSSRCSCRSSTARFAFSATRSAVSCVRVRARARRARRAAAGAFFASGSRAPHAPLPEDPVHVLRGGASSSACAGSEAHRPRCSPAGTHGPLHAHAARRPLHVGDLPRRARRALAGAAHGAGRHRGRRCARRLAAWAEVAGAGFELVWFPGGHFFVHARRAGRPDVVARVLAPLAR
jgi:hypothetical protein